MMIEELRDYVLSNPNLVKMKQSATYPDLYVVKYARKCFYDGIWNEYLEKCRGLVVDKEFNIVVHPFDKIYNYGIEQQCPKFSLDETVTAFRKINGFMVSMTWHRDRLLISTTGSLDSDYVKMVEDMIKDDRHRFEHICKLYDENTFLFECCHPDDPHIIPEELGLYLLGWREKNLESKLRFDPDLLHSYGLELRTNWVDDYFTTVSDLVKLSKNVKHEGFICYNSNGDSCKIKSPYYLMKKFLARKKPEKLITILKENNYKMFVQEEFYPLCEYLKENIDLFVSLDEQSRLKFIRQYISDIN